MDYTKSVIVLRQVEEGFSLSNKTISAIARVETYGGVPYFAISTINAKALDKGEYVVYLMDSRRKMVAFRLGVRAISTTKTLSDGYNFEKGFACGIAYILDGLPTLIAYARTDEFNSSISQFRKNVASELLKKRNFEQKENACQDAYEPPKEYDDEAVATENYFELDREIDNKLGKIREMSDGSLPNADGEVITYCQEEKEQVKEDHCCEQPTSRDDMREKFSHANPYYSVAKRELDNLFDKFPEDCSLKKYFPQSQWVKINYSANKHYIVGLIKEAGREKYICYGVPAEYSDNPPKELDGFCSFIPLSVFDMKGEGYWMMFQDAITGECVKKPN